MIKQLMIHYHQEPRWLKYNIYVQADGIFLNYTVFQVRQHR